MTAIKPRWAHYLSLNLMNVYIFNHKIWPLFGEKVLWPFAEQEQRPEGVYLYRPSARTYKSVDMKKLCTCLDYMSLCRFLKL